MQITFSVSYPHVDAANSAPAEYEQSFFPYEIETSTTLGDLKHILSVNADLPTGYPEHNWLIRHNQQVKENDSQTVADAGIGDGDMLEAFAQPRQATQHRAPAPAPASNGGEAEQLRQMLLSDQRLRNDMRQRFPPLADSCEDPVAFRRAYDDMTRQLQMQQAQRHQERQSLEEVNEENQKKILEEIRRQKIQQDLEEVLETTPELLGRVTMLYVDLQVNGHPVKAFVDSGAQATIISPSCAETCQITHLIDDRWRGVARGVGTANILGRVHRAPVRVGDYELPCAFTVMEGKDVDMLLGLDMLKRYRACIDLEQNCLRFSGGGSVPFLPESEIPKYQEELEAQEPTVSGPGGTSIGAKSGAVKSGGSLGPSSSNASAGPSNFAGAGRTLGSQPSRAPSSNSSQPRPVEATSRPPAPAPAPPAVREAPSFPQESIATLEGIGATREQAIAALAQAGGNVDLAAAIIFESF